MDAAKEAWLRQRKQYLTASDVAAVLGLNSGKSAAAVRRDKLSVELEDADLSHLPQVAAGQHLEPGILAWFAADHPLDVLTPNLELQIKDGWLGATPDAFLDGVPVEAKCCGFEQLPNWHQIGWPDEKLPVPVPVISVVRRAPYNARPNDKLPEAVNDWRRLVTAGQALRAEDFGPPLPPAKYWIQNQVQMYVCGKNEGWVTGTIGGTSRYDFLFEFDKGLFESRILPTITEFWLTVTRARATLCGLGVEPRETGT